MVGLLTERMPIAPQYAGAIRDEEGYLVNPDEWTLEIAELLAAEEELPLNDTHRTIIGYIRQYYAEHQIAPDVRHITALLAAEKHIDKKQAKLILFEHFPYGYVKQACKIAGMKRPRAWSTG